ncbi:MAG: hypothetical protein IKV00_08885, partial [Clostridia bacterium]|nr:hypothetical protein [Clostridia bacterium]
LANENGVTARGASPRESELSLGLVSRADGHRPSQNDANFSGTNHRKAFLRSFFLEKSDLPRKRFHKLLLTYKHQFIPQISILL